MQWWQATKDWFSGAKHLPEEPEKKTIDVMEDDVDPSEVTLENAYKTRWIWYHTILAIEILMTNLLLIAILIVLAVKL